MMEVIVIFDFDTGPQVLLDEDENLAVFRSVREAREAIRGHIAENIARIVELGDEHV